MSSFDRKHYFYADMPVKLYLILCIYLSIFLSYYRIAINQKLPLHDTEFRYNQTYGEEYLFFVGEIVC